MKNLSIVSLACVAGLTLTACSPKVETAPAADSAAAEAAPEAATALVAETAPEAATALVAETAPAETNVAPAVEEAPVDPAAVIVRIGGEPAVTAGELEKALSAAAARFGGQIPPERMAEFRAYMRPRILDQMVTEKVLTASAAKRSITVSAEDRVAFMTMVSNGACTDLVTFAKSANMSEDEVARRIDDAVAIQKMLSVQTNGIPEVTDEEARARFDEIAKENPAAVEKPESVTASHILVKVADFSDTNAVAAARAKIDGLRARALAGEDFGALAEEFSDCPSGKRDKGSLGSFTHGQMVPEFDAAAFAQEKDAIGEVVQTSFGFHIIKVTDKTPASKIAFEDVKEDLRHGMHEEAVAKAVEAFVEAEKKAAKIEYVEKTVVSDVVEAPAAE